MRGLLTRISEQILKKFSVKKEILTWKDVESNPAFCINIFRQLATDNLGYYKPCCQFNKSIINDSGQRYHASIITPYEFINSAPIKEMRKKAIKGEKISGCEYCYQLEAGGIISMRKRDNYAHKKKHSRINVSLEQKDISSFDMRLGNLCNLGCLMCSPGASSFLNAEWIKSGGSRKFSNFAKTNSELDDKFDFTGWYKSQNTLEIIQELGKDLERLMIVGGEPLINKANLDYLKGFEVKGKNLSVDISSNITVLNHDILKVLNKLDTDFKCSIDGFGRTYEYIRYPGKFDIVENNLKELAKYDFNIQVVFSTSILNIFNLPDFVDWIVRMNKETNRKISLSVSNIVFQPDYLSVVNLTPQLKLKVCSMLGEIDEKIKIAFPQNQSNTMEQLKNFIEKSSGDPELVRAGWKYIEHSDQVRGKSWREIVPWVEDILR